MARTTELKVLVLGPGQDRAHSQGARWEGASRGVFMRVQAGPEKIGEEVKYLGCSLSPPPAKGVWDRWGPVWGRWGLRGAHRLSPGWPITARSTPGCPPPMAKKPP